MKIESNMEKEHKSCPYCGEEISINAKKCKHCKEWLTDINLIQEKEKPATRATLAEQTTYQPTPQQYVVVPQVVNKSNGVGTAGFVIALICACLSWVPGVNVFLWLVGCLLSFIGMFSQPRGLAIAGFLISIIDIIIIVALLGAIGSFLSEIL